VVPAGLSSLSGRQEVGENATGSDGSRSGERAKEKEVMAAKK